MQKNIVMKNPFKFGTIVEDDFFTDRINELKYIKQKLDSENHLIMISPRRFGKSSLVLKAVKSVNRPYIMLNLQKVISVNHLASNLLKELFKLYKWEKVKHIASHMRIVPTISINPMTDGVDVSFQPTANGVVALEDAMSLIDKVSTPENRMIVILDEFQEIMSLGKGLDKQMRAIMQVQQNVNYILLGSQESMMTEIFERKKSPFYHFGTLMHLKKIPYNDFEEYISLRLAPVMGAKCHDVAKDILLITDCHPYYTQQLASQVWELAHFEQVEEGVVAKAVERLTNIHDLDFERLWIALTKTDRHLLQVLCSEDKNLASMQSPTSTIYSALNRLMKKGYVIKSEGYEIEDPFFRCWISENRV